MFFSSDREVGLFEPLERRLRNCSERWNLEASLGARTGGYHFGILGVFEWAVFEERLSGSSAVRLTFFSFEIPEDGIKSQVPVPETEVLSRSANVRT